MKTQSVNNLVFENIEAIKKHEQFANQLITSLNLVLERFKKDHNIFSQPVTGQFAFDLVADPLGTFDKLLRANSPIKPIGGKPLDIEKLTELTAIDRVGFINSFTIVLPGSIDQYNKQGRKGMFVLSEIDKSLVRWENDKFVLNEKQLEQDFERFKIYAETPEQIALLERWEKLTNVLNEHAKFIKLDAIDSNRLADMLNVDYRNSEFMPKYERLAKQIKDKV